MIPQAKYARLDLLESTTGNGFSKYRLAKAYIRWTREHTASDLSDSERDQFMVLIEKINKALE